MPNDTGSENDHKLIINNDVLSGGGLIGREAFFFNSCKIYGVFLLTLAFLSKFGIELGIHAYIFTFFCFFIFLYYLFLNKFKRIRDIFGTKGEVFLLQLGIVFLCFVPYVNIVVELYLFCAKSRVILDNSSMYRDEDKLAAVSKVFPEGDNLAIADENKNANDPRASSEEELETVKEDLSKNIVNSKNQNIFLIASIVVVVFLAIDYKPRPWGLPDKNGNGLRDDVDEFIETKLTHLDEAGRVLVSNDAKMIQEVLLKESYSEVYRKRWWKRIHTESDCSIYYGQFTNEKETGKRTFESRQYEEIKKAKRLVKDVLLNSVMKERAYESFWDGFHMWSSYSDPDQDFYNYIQLEEVCGFSEETSNKMRKYYIEHMRKRYSKFMKYRLESVYKFETWHGEKYRHRYDQYFFNK